MNSAIEQGLVSRLTTVVSAVTPAVAVLPGTSGGTIPNSQPSIIAVMELPHTAGKLYLGNERIVISTPAKIDGCTLTTHRALVKLIREALAWDDDDAAASTKDTALDTAVFAASNFHTRGFFFVTARDAQSDEMWQTTLEITRGLEGPLAS